MATIINKLREIEDDLLHKRFKNKKELEEYIKNFLGVSQVTLTRDNQSDFESEKADYDFIGEVRNNENLVADIEVYVLYDRQKYLYVTEFEIIEIFE